MDERLAEAFIIVVPSEREDSPTILEELAEDFLPVADRLAQAIRAREFAEKVACHEQHIDLFLLAMRSHTLDSFAEIVGAVNAAEMIAEMPIGGMENPHADIVVGFMVETKVRSEKRHEGE
jgi:hypothetical protein